MDVQQVLERIRQQPRGQTSLKHLARLLRVRGEQRAALQQMLEELIAAGRLVEVRRGHYLVPGVNSEYVSGRLSLHRQGYGFVIPDQPIPGIEGDIYISPRATAEAMHGDRVLVRQVRVSADGRLEGRVERILKRAHESVVGQFCYSPRGSWVIPHDERVRQQIGIPQGMEIPPPGAAGERLGNVSPPAVRTPEELDGLIVNVEMTQFPSKVQEARGRVTEILGRPDDFGVDVEVIIRKFHLPYRFSADVKQEAAAISGAIDTAELERRRDFRDRQVVTIDGETARDFDDAVWVERLGNGNFALQVHIADVSHYVRPGSALDRDARLRGTSVYFPDRAVPMLPPELSTDICSLRPGVDRLVLSVLLEIDHQAEVVKTEFCRGVIRSVERMTYTDVNRLLEGDPEPCRRYGPLVERFQLMRDLAMILGRRRQRRGSIDFDLPDPLIEFDELGMMISVGRAERNIAHRIIEEFMLAANEAVARRLEERGVPALYRIHEKPDPGRVLQFEELAATFGHSLGVHPRRKRFGYTQRRRDGSKASRGIYVTESDLAISPHHYQKLIAAIAGKPEEQILSYQMLRSLKQARYSENNSGHFALATATYTHFTSPIRRYPDLVVHRILKAVLDQGPVSPYHDAALAGPVRASELVVIASECSLTERRAADAERALMDWKKARFMEERLGDEFGAIVVAVTPAGLFVELLDLFIEGLVPIGSFAADRFEYRENLRALVGARSQRRFTLGNRLRVRADRVSFDEMRTEFSCVGDL